jgi:hypothetical protein
LPESLTEACHAPLMQPSTMLNPGNLDNDRSVRVPGRLA